VIPGYELAAKNIPSQEVGGDYYDCINLGAGKFAFIIADVAGKGIGAALLVNTLSAALYSYLDFNVALTEMSDKLNKLIFKASPPDKYITFFIAVLDSTTGKLDAVNAGHNPVYLLRNNGNLEKISAGGVGLGMFDFGIPFKGETLDLQPGDRLFLYTDGIPEAMDQSENEYTDERMINFFRANSGKAAADFVDAMVEDVRVHTSGFPQSDDITLLVLKRN
jgi:serine phosphatase RsbU (regulator of sigma subunit)